MWSALVATERSLAPRLACSGLELGCPGCSSRGQCSSLEGHLDTRSLFALFEDSQMSSCSLR